MERRDNTSTEMGIIKGCSKRRRRRRRRRRSMSMVKSIDDSDIQDEILIEIFLRLPLKTIFKFKSVSKRWISLISHPVFATCSLDRVARTNSLAAWDLLYQYGHCGTAKYPVPMSLHVAFKHHPEFTSPGFSLDFLARHLQQDEPPKIFAQSNGLLLCCKTRFSQTDYYVCNPLTTQWVPLPKPPRVGRKYDVHIGFICSSQDGSYKLVRITDFSKDVFDEVQIFSDELHLEIFSSDIGKWMDVEVSCPRPVSMVSYCSAVLCNGIMHWVAYSPKAIIAYDPNKNPDHCRLINLPRDCSLIHRLLGVCCESLCYLQNYKGLLSLWVLEDYDAGEWCLRCVVPLRAMTPLHVDLKRSLSEFGFFLKPLAFHPFNRDIVYLGNHDYIVSCNIRKKELTVVSDRLFPRSIVTREDIFSFVLPTWPTLIPPPTWEYN